MRRIRKQCVFLYFKNLLQNCKSYSRLKRLFIFYIESSIHVALSVSMLLIISSKQLQVSTSKSLVFFTFFATVVGYNFLKYNKVILKKILETPPKLKPILISSFLSALAMLVLASKLSIQSLGVTLVCGGITFFYTTPLFNNKNLRSFSGLKIFIVGLIWATVVVWLPICNNTVISNLPTNTWLTFFQRIIMVIVLTLPFEIRDMYYDDIHLVTFPQFLGIKKTKKLGTLMLFLVIVLEFLKNGSTLKDKISLFFFCSVTVLFLWRASKKQSPYYASFWVEAIPIFWILFIFVLQKAI